MEGRQSDLQDKWALVTGASSGFGIDFAHLLAARGANLVLVARRSAPMKALAAELKQTHGTHCHVIAMDLAHPGIKRLLALTRERGLLLQIAFGMEDPRVHHPALQLVPVTVAPLASVKVKAARLPARPTRTRSVRRNSRASCSAAVPWSVSLGSV